MRRVVLYTAATIFVVTAGLSLVTLARPPVGVHLGWAGVSVYRGHLWAFGPWGPNLVHLPVWAVLAWSGTAGLLAHYARPVAATRRRGFAVAVASAGSSVPAELGPAGGPGKSPE